MSLKRVESETGTVYIQPDQVDFARVYSHDNGRWNAVLYFVNSRRVVCSPMFNGHADAENWVHVSVEGVRY